MPDQYPFELSDLNKELEEELEPGEELEEEDFEEIKIEVPTSPSFPIGTLIVAIIKDAIDIFSLGILGTFTNIIAWIVLWLYVRKRMGFIKRRLYRKFITRLLAEFTPFVNMFPWWTFFVLRAHATEREKLNQILTTIEKLIIRHQKTA